MRTKVFISYSHKDERWRERLVEQLQVLEKQGLLQVWDDTRIGAGDDWYKRINEAMLECRVAVLLISSSFLTSDFILEEEVPKLIDCHEDDGMSVVPLLVRACPWQEVKWLARLQLRPADGKPLAGRKKAAVEKLLSELALEMMQFVRKAGVGQAAE